MAIPLSEYYDQIERQRADVKNRYRSALQAIQETEYSGANSQAIDKLNAVHQSMTEEQLLNEREEQLNQSRTDSINERWNNYPGYDDIFAHAVYRKGMDVGLGIEEWYRKNYGTEKEYLDFLNKKAAVNAKSEAEDPSYYDYGNRSQNAFGEVTNAAGTMFLPAVSAYVFGRLTGPMLGMPAGFGTGNAATKAVPHEAANNLLKNMFINVAHDGLWGAVDQRETALGSALTSAAGNLILRGVGHSLERIPDVNNDQIRETIDLVDELQKKYGDNFSLFKPSTWWKTGNNLRMSLAHRVRSPSMGAEYNAKMRAPWSRDAYDSFQSDRQGFIARFIKGRLLPGSEEVLTPGTTNTIDREWMQNYLQEAKKTMDAFPTSDIDVDHVAFTRSIDELQDTYGDAIAQIPAVKKHFNSVRSMLEKHAVKDAQGNIVSVTMTPEFYKAKKIELDKAISELEKSSYGSQSHIALNDLRELLIDQAAKANPDFHNQVAYGKNMYAAYNRLLKIVDPYTGTVDLRKAAKYGAEDVARGRGIPLTYDLNGKERNVFNDVSDISWLLDPKNLTSATLHDNQAQASKEVVDTTLGLGQRMKAHGVRLFSGIGNSIDESIGSIPIRYDHLDPKIFGRHFGLSPTQSDALRTMVGSGIIHGRFQSDPEFLIQNEKDLINEQQAYEMQERLKRGLLR